MPNWDPIPGLNDWDVIYFRQSANSCKDTFLLPPLSKWSDLRLGPGIVPLNNSGFGIDEAEISNLEWKFFQQQTTPDTGLNEAMQPLAAALPVPEYYADRFYHRYPVVGISWEQADAFCRWRSRVVTAEYNKLYSHADSLSQGYVRILYRLPTEAEWEIAAQGQSGLPYGSSCLNQPVQINPKAADYLKRRSGSQETSQQIRADIESYNRSQPSRVMINYAQKEPYFLRQTTPGYVWQGPPNAFGLYQALGNAAEMVQEQGITKGGSYLDPLEACTIKARGSYSGPAPHIGFRCASEVSYPNRK
ncbi:formylglycine-generating enzyme family protein [Hymenobacter gelipurpurascens]|uniref:formylglycine-generating enzyme family protein n=1 Tax=Hymenobacter gelipurpurascens TaxID=89968 RepID=UPI001481E2C7|nr:SUMF1/EgtB/PvdO family nonheme iron enzyme [Hymenobacter gelipurpurascens]